MNRSGVRTMKKLVFSAIFVVLIAYPVGSMAQNTQNNSVVKSEQGSPEQTVTAIPTNYSIQDQVKTQDQTEQQTQNVMQTQNEDEKNDLVVNTQEEKQNPTKKPNPRSSTARNNMSEVAQKVEELLAGDDLTPGIGDQVRLIAREQQTAQLEIDADLDRVESRSGLMKKLFGTDYSAIRRLNILKAQNWVRIQQLEQLAKQLDDINELAQLNESIQVLSDQNTALQEQILAEENISSLFGWLARLLVKST